MLGIVLSCYIDAQSQNRGSQRDIIYYRDGSVFIGEIIVDYTPDVRIALITGDTITLNRSLIKRRIDGNDIIIYPKGKYHFTSGSYASFEVGFSFVDEDVTTLVCFQVEKIISEKIDLGLSFGVHSNSKILSSPNGFVGFWLDSFTMPIVGQAKYYLNNQRIRVYGVGKLGYGFAISGGFNNSENQKGGLNLYGGLGLTFASKWNGKFFIELAQYTQKASGTIFETDFNLQPVILDYDVWFNNVVFSYGLRYKL